MPNGQLSMHKYIYIRYHIFPYTKYKTDNNDNTNTYKKNRKTQVMSPLTNREVF